MALGKRLIQTSGTAVCNTETVTAFGADAAYSHNVALYQLDGNDNDTTGNYSGIAENNITYASGYIGNAAVFNGSSSSIELPNSSLGITDASNFSISYWFNTNSTTQDNQSVIWANGSNAGARFGSGINSTSQGGDTSIYFGMPVDGSFTYINSGTSAFTADTWVHVVGVKSSITGMSLYVNNVLKATNTSATGSASATATGKNSIGMYHTSSDSLFFNGEIDQLRIFNREITSSEVSTLYAETSSTASNTNPLGDGAGVALYSLDFDASETSGLFSGSPTDVDFGVGGQINTGARFNGSSSFISASNILDTSAAFSYSLWINPNSIATYDFLIGHQQAASPYAGVGLLGGSASNTFALALAGGAPQAMTPALTLNTWSHIVLTHDGSGGYKCYTNNGSPISYSGATSNNSANPFRLGFSSVSGWGYYDGSIDQVRLFTKELSASEVGVLYAETACVHTSTTDNNDFPVTNAAYYKLDNSAEDSKGTNDGTETNIEYRFGRFGQAAVFNGSSSKITRESLFDNTQVKMSASVWVKATDYSPSGNINILDIGDNDTTVAQNRIFISGTSPHNIFASVNGGDGGFAQASQSFTDNSWNHIVVTWDVTGGGVTNGIKIYLNGSLAAQGNSSQGFNSARDLAIGVNEDEGGDRHHFSGSIDNVRIFASELSAANVTSLYNEKPETDTSNFKAVLYKGTSASQYISNVGMDLETSGGLVWIKNRDQADNHTLVDSVRGISTSGTKYIASNTTDDEDISTNMPVSLEKNGFFVQGVAGVTNTSGEDYVSWVFKGGGTAVQNNDGTINGANCMVSANAAAGFSIVNYVGTGSSGATFGHGLGAKPDLILIKNRDHNTNYHWTVYSNTSATGATGLLYLNETDAFTTTSSRFNDTEPTTSIVTLGNDPTVNDSGDDHIAYCFKSINLYSSVGVYDGDNSTSGNITTTGFQPSFLLIKNISNSTSTHWGMFDNRRDTTNPNTARLLANLNNAESTTDSNWSFNFLSNGFEPLVNSNQINASGSTYLYLAIK